MHMDITKNIFKNSFIWMGPDTVVFWFIHHLVWYVGTNILEEYCLQFYLEDGVAHSSEM